MGRIRVLDDVLANQIAAGEVVERPASVIKELLENSVDAGATAITVELAGGGVELLRVVDDGCGMDRDDAVLALQRHATSKLKTASDLHHIRTLGFRGEAIPSIASVSRFAMRTRQPETLGALRVTVEGGKDLEVREAPGPVGTEIRVEDLFFNVPARRKFLKKPATESSHVQEAVQRVALCYPEIAFRLIKDGRTAFDLPRHGTLADRVRAVFGKRVAGRLAPVDLDGLPGVDGLIGPPDEARATARHYHTFINGRFVRDRVIMSAIKSAYGNRLERNRHPFVVLRLRLPPEALDVNVHPAKTEVRYVDSGGVHRLVSSAIDRTLRDEPWAVESPAEAPDTAPAPSAPTSVGGSAPEAPADEGGLAGHRRRIFDAMERIAARRPGLGAGLDARPSESRGTARPAPPESQLDLGVAPAGGVRPLRLRPSAGGSVRAELFDHRRPAPPPGDRAPERPGFLPPRDAEPVDETASTAGALRDEPPPPQAPPGWLVEAREAPPRPPRHAAPEPPSTPPAMEPTMEPTVLGNRPTIGGLRFGGLTPLAPLDGLLLCTAADGLVGVDIAAARSRVRFDRLLRRPDSKALGRPISVDLDADGRARLAERASGLEALGFGVEPFGGATHVIGRVPAVVSPVHALAALQAILDTPFEGEEPLAELAAAALAVCPDTRPIDPAEARALLAQLDALEHRPPRPEPLAFALTVAELRRALSAG